ncbi:HAD-IIIA family hydrolase [Cloacibacillus porcorum]|uniref:HAD-IIIA family hydrolase n=1 Tax=Cloacibacillus porcorum TaxID=1197717 RepID=UPI0023F2DCB3|nr:HAD-IIIA family hydrolase [Cloacibacillus porcorum]MDD7648607.1 HAD-IIIA family hydrolase [Cloacibacillus porcorum]MDY4092997.1 HAD-IIIA family hydrolase [Cloacibacillus porcorum]
MSRWIILDRDGTLIREKGYLHDPKEVELIAGVTEGLRLLAAAEYRFAVVTNQSGIGRGYYSEGDMRAVHARIDEILAVDGIKIDGWYHCPHLPEEGCGCRKPKRGLVETAAAELGFSLTDIAAVIGDKECDLMLAKAVGAPSALVMSGYGSVEYAKGVRGDLNCEDMSETARRIIKKEENMLEKGEIYRRNMDDHLKTAVRMAALEETVCLAAKKITAALLAGGRLFLCGNGGSAADAQHIAAELSGRYLKERRALDAAALSCNSSALTALGNDYGYDEIFSRQIEAHGRCGDLLIAISTSGNSANVLKAVSVAKGKGIFTVGLTGENGGRLREAADLTICAPSSFTPRIQEIHILIGHTICEMVERDFCG